MKGKMLSLEDTEAVHTSSFIKKRGNGINYKDKSLKIDEASNHGITLVALVVTIVILLILAGITLIYVFGDNGIIKLAKQAKNETEAGIGKEQDDLGTLANMLKEEYGNNAGNGDGGEGNGDNTTNPPDQPEPPVEDQTVASIVDKIQDSNTTVEDKNGNPIIVPGGFKVVPNGTGEGNSRVDYTYNGDGTPTVQDGIVIEDNEGNQFVWIPVGEIKNKDGSTTTITLGRYEFNTNDGTPTLKQNADNYTQTVTINGYEGSYYQELTSNSGNTAAKNLGDFITKAKANGGYYFGRYEASKGSDNKVKLQYDKSTWGNIEQLRAATVSREMYSSNYVESDLINSYSWDTAIVFIQKYSGNTNYANKKSVNSSKLNTGKAGDKVCNIHDMASNCVEWSTEHSTFAFSDGTRVPCAFRGGVYNISYSSAAFRNENNSTYSNATLSFRPICYMK